MRCNSPVIGDEPPPPRVASCARAASRAGDAPVLAGDEPPSPVCHQSTSRPPGRRGREHCARNTHQSAMDAASSRDAGERCREEDDSALNSKASFRRPP
ncbi:hypothetical protein BDA96_02G118000 [Sorghum bicolor]|uniref:Uncharacterized protein n=2 Tax=Sorghum bicolor TaxID=4558 RepID=A0A921RLF8_SORBI|nr:hypothetical protein BDA96_02G118000 [Sorghum bicolor]KXG34947.1 hypothetical protein SORBI_3002G112200 [Sorghum bicolor]